MLELVALLPRLPKCWNCICVLLCVPGSIDLFVLPSHGIVCVPQRDMCILLWRAQFDSVS